MLSKLPRFSVPHLLEKPDTFWCIASGIAIASAAAVLQYVFWRHLSPLSWILFYPSVYFSARVGGLLSASVSGLLSTVYVGFLFSDPLVNGGAQGNFNVMAAIVFVVVAVLIGEMQEHIFGVNRALRNRLEQTESENHSIKKRYKDAVALEGLHFTDLANSLPQIVWATDAQGHTIYFNDQWMAYTGMSHEESLGPGWNQPFHSEDRSLAWDAWDYAVAHNASYHVECRLRRHDGVYRWWLIRGVPSRDVDGQVVGWFGTCTDIQDLKEFEKNLLDEKNKLEVIISSNPEGIAILDKDGFFVSINDRFAKYFKFPGVSEFPGHVAALQSLIKKTSFEGRDIPDTDWPCRRALNGESASDQEMRLERLDTHETWCGSASFSPVRDAEGQVTGAVVAVRDITARVNTETALKALLNEQDLMLNTGIGGIARMKDRRFVWVNKVFEGYFGYSNDELRGHLSRMLYETDEAFLAFGEHVRSLSAMNREVAAETKLRKRNGETGWFKLGGVATDGAEGDIIWTIIDVTQDKKNLEDANSYLRRLQHAMEDTLHALSKTIDMRDPYTAGHQNRVGVIAKEIGRILGLPDNRCEYLYLIGLVHDIGKIGIPSEILTKPTRLTDLEHALVKTHVGLSHEILQNVKFDFPVADVVLQHHERLDGSGYPRGLKGEQITMDARILSVADVFEAMASHRPYRAALGVDVALAELQEGRGIKYDAEAVDACVKLFTVENFPMPKA